MSAFWMDEPRLTEEELVQKHKKAEADTEALLVAISSKCAQLRALLRKARTTPDGWAADGSFGLAMASQKLYEAEMWANKEIRSRHGAVWP